MPTPCYISIEGETQGLITAGACTADSIGDAFVEGHEDEMLVQQFDHNVTVQLIHSLVSHQSTCSQAFQIHRRAQQSRSSAL